jgi:uncharacterized protein (TIGR02118 family)
MFKAAILLTRRPDLSKEAFVAWWSTEHVPLATRLPGLRRMVVNVVEEANAEGAPDGISELWFDSREAFDAAYATEIGKAVAADTMAHVTARVRLIVDEREVFGG